MDKSGARVPGTSKFHVQAISLLFVVGHVHVNSTATKREEKCAFGMLQILSIMQPTLTL